MAILPLERRRALDRQETAGALGVDLSPLEEALQIATRSDDRQATVRPIAERPGTSRKVEGSLEGAPPRARRPAAPDRQQGDVVARVLIPFEVDVTRDPNAGGQGLDRHPSLDESRHVDMALTSANEKIPAEQQQIGVQIDHVEGRMQLARPLGDRFMRRCGQRIESAFRPGDEPSASERRGDGHRGDGHRGTGDRSTDGRSSQVGHGQANRALTGRILIASG